jgi:nucleotide-binding universal stress UspA family protein
MAFKIVVGYDGSEGAKAALAEALSLARQLSGKVFVAYAYGGPKTYAGAPLTPRRQLKELGEHFTTEALKLASGSGVAIESVLVEESASDGLLNTARQHRADMIVVGTHGGSPIRGALLGSTTYKLVHNTTKPVLVVPAKKRGRQAV